MMKITVRTDELIFGRNFAIAFERTLRIPDDGNTYPLPPGLGTFPISKVEDYRERVPSSWLEHGGVFIPMYQSEALWIYFNYSYGKPRAVKIAVGKVNAVSGEKWDQSLHSRANDYMVCPPQPWLDGINAGEGYIRQFVAMPLGSGYTVEGQVTGEEKFGGIQIIVYKPKPEKIKNNPRSKSHHGGMVFCSIDTSTTEMGLAAGGKMNQKIYPDPHGIDVWDQENYGCIYVHIVNSAMYSEITGKKAPAAPISAKTYSDYGLPWFDLYDDKLGDIPASATLEGVKTVKQIDKEKGLAPQQDDDSLDVPDGVVIKYPVGS